MKKTFFYAIAAALLGLLTACGGGGDETSVAISSPVNAPKTLGGAVSASQYDSAQGVGVWEFVNQEGNSPHLVQMNISGTTAGTTAAQLVLTNTTNQPISLASLATSSSRLLAASASSYSPSQDAQAAKDQELAEQTKRIIAGLKPASDTMDNRLTASSVTVYASEVPVVGTARVWSNCKNLPSVTGACQDAEPSVPTTLVAQRSIALYTGEAPWTVNVWVADAERGVGKVTDEMAVALADAYAGEDGVFQLTRRVGGGNPWGAHSFPDVIDGGIRTVDLVVANLTPDGKPLGLVGFFSTLDTLKKSYAPASNEALALFLDSETAYLAADGVNLMKGTVAHEATHLRNFYNRQLRLLGAQFDPWLEEMTAMAFEELYAGSALGGFSPAQAYRLPYFLHNGSANCTLREFNSYGGQCFGYAVGGSFGAYMLRNYGHEFLRNIWASVNVYSDRVFKDAVEPFVKDAFTATQQCALPANYAQMDYNGKEAAGTLLYRCKEQYVSKVTRQWHQATMGGISLARVQQSAPMPVGYPALAFSDASTGLHYSLAAIDMKALSAQYRMDYSTPATLAPGGSYVWTVHPGSSLEQSVTIPAGTVLSVLLD